MKLSQLASKPQLIKLTLDDEAVIKEHGEAIEFYTWDRQPLEVFMKLATANQSNTKDMIDIVRTLILDEDGRQIIQGDAVLPGNMMILSIAKIVETLGK